ncbi:hypothetical protein MRX96_030387 [Rhipicephalus microplus]
MVDTSPWTSGAILLHGMLGHRSTSTPRPADQFLNVQCTEDCPASVHGEIASSITRPVVVSAAVPHSTVDAPASTDFNKPHGLLLLSSCRLASLPVTRTWSSLLQFAFKAIGSWDHLGHQTSYGGTFGHFLTASLLA